jgi:predicted CopG family antitoxin
METKTIKISAELYEALDFCRDRNSESAWESRSTIITKLLARYDDTCRLIHEDGSYWFVINGRKRSFPELSHTTENVRITQSLHDALNDAKIHPDETINTVLQRLLFSYYGNKLVYRINIESASNKDSQDLIFFMHEILLTEPKFNNALFVEVLSIDNYPDIKSKYNKNKLPLSILYDYEDNEIWRMEGKHDLNEVRKKLESFIDSSEEFFN